MMAIAIVLALAAAAITLILRDEPETAVASKTKAASFEPLVRGEPPGDAWTEKSLTRPEQPVDQPEPEQAPQPAAEPEPGPRPSPEPEPERESPRAGQTDWPEPTDSQVRAAREPRRYQLPPGAIMGLTARTLNLYNAPVFDSSASWALNNGIAHVPQTSLPWSRTPERNVYLEGHRLGWPGTRSHLVFYYLNRLDKGDEVLLRDRSGKKYRYRVSETFVVDPDDSWVMGRVRGRDMVTLQTCTPIPTFERRLIVRADRV